MNYSIVIRTIGKAGEKYQKLLNSIERLDIKPLEILVVLPKGYDLPQQQLGYEKFVFSEKGMVNQRIFGGQEAKGEYILFLDDDVEFSSSLVNDLYEPIKNELCELSVPAYDSLFPPKKGLQKVIPWVTYAAVPMLFSKNMYVKILKSGGWSYNYNHSDKYLLTQSAAGMCCLCSKKDFLNIHYEHDLWLEDCTYALWEDQVMYYKFCLNGYKIMSVNNINITHLDAGTSTDLQRIKNAAFANARNKSIFWYKYIYCQQQSKINKLFSIIAFQYHKLSTLFIYRLASMLRKSKKEEYEAFKNGYKSGRRFIKHEE